jgi:hypothetical protein
MSTVFPSAGQAESASPATITLANGLTPEQLRQLIFSLVNGALTLRRLGSQIVNDVGDRGEGIPGHIVDAMESASLHAECVETLASQIGWVADQVARACGMPGIAFARNAEGWLLSPVYNQAAQVQGATR